MQSSTGTMGLGELNRLAKKAASKLEREGQQKQRNLRRLVLTANMIDELADEIDGLKSRGARPQVERSCHPSQMFGWADKVAEGLGALERQRDDAVEDDEDDQSDSESDSDMDSISSDEADEATTPRRLSEENVQIKVHECAMDVGEDWDYDWDMGEVTDLSLKLFPSTSVSGQHIEHAPDSEIVCTELEYDSLLDAVDQAVLGQT